MRRAIGAVALGLVLLGGGVYVAARAQDGADDDENGSAGIGLAPGEATATVTRAILAMGARDARLQNAVMTVQAEGPELRERHTLRLDGRYMHYASRRPSGAGFDVVLARRAAFLTDRNPAGEVTYVEDLGEHDAQEGAYERDVLFMPLLLPTLLERGARMESRGRNSVGDEVIRALVPPAVESPAQPFVIRLRFAKDTGFLVSAMGVVPCGADQGKKRYCTFDDYRKVEGSDVYLPHTISDQRGKDQTPRTFKVRWTLNADLPATLFVRPHAPSEGDEGH